MNALSQFILRQLAERKGLTIVRVEETPGVIHVVQALDPDWDGVSVEDRIAQLAEDLNRGKHKLIVKHHESA